MRSKKDTKVVIAIPMLLHGGTEIQTLALVRVLKHEGYRVTVCCYYESEKEMVGEFERDGARVERLNLYRFQQHTSYGRMLILLWALIRYFRSTKPDIVHVQYMAPGLIPVIAAKVAGIKSILATIHYPRHMFGEREKRFVHLAANLCSMFFCNSIATERSWFGAAEMSERIDLNSDFRHCTVYNAIDTENIARRADSRNSKALKKRLGIKANHVIGVVARLRTEKGHPFLLQAMVRVLHSLPDTTLLVVGDGPDKIALKTLAEKLHIGENITWLGAKSQEETFQLYGLMDIIVVPSEFEGFGLSAAEAMAAGLPVIASDVDGLREVVEDGETGLLVTYGDAEKMSSAILKLFSDKRIAQAMGKKGKRRVTQMFPLSKFHDTMTRVYAQL